MDKQEEVFLHAHKPSFFLTDRETIVFATFKTYAKSIALF